MKTIIVIISILATQCPSSSYADQQYVLTATANTGNNATTTPHCVVGIGVPNVTWRTTAHDAVFLCALLPVRVMTGCIGVSQDTPVPSAGTPTLYNLSPSGLASLGDGSYLNHLEANIMANQTNAVNPSVTSTTTHYYSLDTFFTPKADASSRSAHDVVDTLLSQAHATVIALSRDGQNLADGFSFSQEIICNLLWSIQTQIEMAQAAMTHLAQADAAKDGAK